MVESQSDVSSCLDITESSEEICANRDLVNDNLERVKRNKSQHAYKNLVCHA